MCTIIHLLLCHNGARYSTVPKCVEHLSNTCWVSFIPYTVGSTSTQQRYSPLSVFTDPRTSVSFPFVSSLQPQFLIGHVLYLSCLAAFPHCNRNAPITIREKFEYRTCYLRTLMAWHWQCEKIDVRRECLPKSSICKETDPEYYLEILKSVIVFWTRIRVCPKSRELKYWSI